MCIAYLSVQLLKVETLLLHGRVYRLISDCTFCELVNEKSVGMPSRFMAST